MKNMKEKENPNVAQSSESIKFNVPISYKNLCELFGEPPISGGTNRNRQLKRFGKKYEIVKVGRGKYSILREKTLEEIQLKSDQNNYSRYLQAILLNMIANSPEIEMIFTYREIRENLMMVNSKYFPVKYHKEKIQYDVPSAYESDEDNKPIYHLEKDWMRIADQHDKAAIKYALKCLKSKNLLTSLNETYLFYKFEKDKNGNQIYHPSVEASKQQLAEINQLQLEYIKDNIPDYQMDSIKKKIAEKEDDLTNLDKIDLIEASYNGYLIKGLYSNGKNLVEGYYKIIEDYIKKLGYDKYARAFKIIRPTKLKAVAGYFAPVFNEKQVERYLTTKRFETMPIFFHHQLVEKLIKED